MFSFCKWPKTLIVRYSNVKSSSSIKGRLKPALWQPPPPFITIVRGGVIGRVMLLPCAGNKHCIWPKISVTDLLVFKLILFLYFRESHAHT